MPSDGQWREFLAKNQSLIRNTRLQSKAFVRGEQLSVISLEFNSKHQSTSQFDFTGWASIDYPPPHNFAAKLPPNSKTVAHADIDIDLKPITGEWTFPLLARAASLVSGVMDIIVTIGGFEALYRYGRSSLLRDGHCYVPVAFGDKAGLERLRSLKMRKAVEVGPFKLRIEVRVPGEEPKTTITLPGSIYPGYLGGYDPILWRTQLPDSDLADPLLAFPRRTPEPLSRIVKGVWAGLLAAVVEPQWDEGSRHETALLVSGVLAHEVHMDEPFITADEAHDVLRRICDMCGDDDPDDRLRTLDNSLVTRAAGRPVTGYTRLADLIGPDARSALLRMRGGADPDAFAALVERVAYVKTVDGQDDVFVNLETAGHGAVICKEPAIRRHFHPRAEFPPILRARGVPIPMIDQLLRSRQLRRYHAAVILPGVRFGSILVQDGNRFRDATNDERIDPEGLNLINIGTGYRTVAPETEAQVNKPAWDRWWKLWHRHLLPLTRGNETATQKLEYAIAWAVQRPLEKIALGLCLTGDGGIGKSVTFDEILPRLLGRDVFATANSKSLAGNHPLADIEGKKFYKIEEVNLRTAPNEIKELLKDAMKNARTRSNKKYGAERMVDNLAIIILLTNEAEPMLSVSGQQDRSLAVIQGETRENTGRTVEQWAARRNEIHRHVTEFVAALEDPDVREAAMFYFDNLPVERADLEDNTALAEQTDLRDALNPIDEAIISIFEDDMMHPDLGREFALSFPFKSQWFLDGINRKLKARNVSRRELTVQHVMRRLRSIVGKEALDEKTFRDADNKLRKVFYFTIKYGDLIRNAGNTVGFPLSPAYELGTDDFGVNDVTPEQCRRVWELTPNVGNVGY